MKKTDVKAFDKKRNNEKKETFQIVPVS